MSCLVLFWLYFFLATPPRSNPWTDFNHLWLKWRVVTQGCAFWGFGWGSKPPWRGVVRHFPAKMAKLQNRNISGGNIGSIPNFDRVIESHSWLRGWSTITKFVFKMADGRHIAKCWKRYNSPISGPIWMKLGWSHPIMSPTCPPWCGCRRLEAEGMNQFWWNLVCNSKLGPQWQSHDQILKFLKFDMEDGRHVGKYWKCHNSPTNGPTGTQLGWSHPIMFSTCPPCRGCYGNVNFKYDDEKIYEE